MVLLRSEYAEHVIRRAGGRDSEFWEGCVLIIGGLYLVHQVSKAKPAYVAVSPNANLAADVSGLTNKTNQAGQSSLTLGEPLAAPQPVLQSASVPVRNPTTTRPIVAQRSGQSYVPIVSPARYGAPRYTAL